MVTNTKNYRKLVFGVLRSQLVAIPLTWILHGIRTLEKWRFTCNLILHLQFHGKINEAYVSLFHCFPYFLLVSLFISNHVLFLRRLTVTKP